MKKIMSILALGVIVFLVAACGETTGNSVKDTTPTTTTTTTASCGDGECTEDEMCNVDTLKPGCVEDCGECPSRLYTKGFDCGATNCRETSENSFEISGDSNIKLEIVNLGGVLGRTIEAEGFKCYVGNEKVISNYLMANYKGYILRDGKFDGEKEDVRLASRGNKGDRVTYRMDFEVDKLSQKETPFELRCVVDIRTKDVLDGKEDFNIVNLKFI